MASGFSPFSELAHLRSDGLRPTAVLSLSMLRSLDPAGLAGLAKLGITTLSELLHFEPVHRSRVVMSVARGEVGHEVDLEHYLDAPPASLDGIGTRSTAAVLGIGPALAEVLEKEFGVATIAGLAAFEPFREAEALLAEQSSAFSEVASAPDELVPRFRAAAATRVRYSSIVREDSPRHGLRLSASAPALGAFDPALAGLFLGYTGKPGAREVARTTLFQPDLGFALLHEQSWVPLGLQLGDPVKAIGLSPGEVRKVAVVDWQQSLSAGRTEGTEAREQLNSLLVHQRALDEVVRTTAEEHQAGRTDTLAATGMGAAAGVGSGALVGALGGALVGGLTGGVAGVPLGALLGLIGGGGAGAAVAAPTGEAAAPATVPAGAAAGVPAGGGLGGLAGTLTGSVLGSAIGSLGGGAAAAIAGSLLGSASGAIGHVESTSSGSRDIFGKLNQNITDVASQKSSNIRSLRSTVVVDVTQSEQETLSTYVIANNNRAHALTVTYFELLSRYGVDTRTARVDPLIFIPYAPLDFTFDLAARYWHVLRLGLGNPGLVAAMDALLTSADFFDQSLAANVTDRAAAELRSIEVKLTASISATDPLSYKVTLLAGAREVALTFRSFINLGQNGVEMLFSRSNLTVPVGDVTDLRVSIGLTAGVTVTPKVTKVTINPGNGNSVFRDISLGSKTFPSGTSQQKDFPFDPLALIGAREEAQRGEQLVVDRVLDVLNRRAYFFTRFVLTGIDPAEFEDLVEAMLLTTAGGPSLRLTALVDPRPVGFVGGSIVFRLKRDPDLAQIITLKPSAIPGLPVERFDWLVPGFMPKGLTQTAAEARLNALRRLVGPYLDFIDEVATREAEEREAAAVRREIALPSPGVFAEAILGRSIAAEKIDPTRYIAWDLPNPNAAPEIAALAAGGRGLGIPDLSPSDTSGELGLQAPTPLPDPAGLAQAFAALASLGQFRDMSGRSDLLGALPLLAAVAAQGAGQAGTLAGGAQSAALGAATGLASKVADTVAKVSDTTQSLTEFGAKLNTGQIPAPKPTPTPTPTIPTGGGGGGGGGGSTPTPPAQPPASSERAIFLKGLVDVQNGVKRILEGRYTVTFSPPGDQAQSPLTGISIDTVTGSGNTTLLLPPGGYTVRGEYQALNKQDLALLREPQRDSFGVNGGRLMELAVDLFQQDLAGQLTVQVPIRADGLLVTPLTSAIKIDIAALVAEATTSAIDLTFTAGNEFSIDGSGRVTFDSSKLGDTAQKIADTMKGGFLSALGSGVGFVADALSVFTINSTIGQSDVLKAGANGKVTFSFRPSFLRDFAITATPVA